MSENLVIAAGTADLPKLRDILNHLRIGHTDLLCALDAIDAAIAKAALSEDEGVAEDALTCAMLIANRIELEESTILRHNSSLLHNPVRNDWFGTHFLIIHSDSFSEASKMRFGIRYLEFKFDVALRDNPKTLTSAIENACFNLLLRGSLHAYELQSKKMADVYLRIMDKHKVVRMACDKIFNSFASPLYNQLPRDALMLGVNTGLIKVDLKFFCSFLCTGSLVSRPAEIYNDDVALLSKQLVDLDSQQSLDFNRPGVISCTDHSVDYMILDLNKCPYPILHKSIMSNLLRCRQFVEHDPRFAAWSILQKIRSQHCRSPYFRFSSLTSAEVWFCCEWLRSELFRNSEIAKRSSADVITLFRKSTPSTAQDVWSLVLMSKDFELGLDSLRSIYHPFMTDAALRCLLWNNSLCATSLVHIRECHYRILTQILARTNGNISVCNLEKQLSLATREVHIIRMFPHLFPKQLPPRARHVVVGFLL